MERDCMIGHGASIFLKETFVERSDIFAVRVCGKCGLIATRTTRKNYWLGSSGQRNDAGWYCRSCNNSTDVPKIVIPYAFKLLIHELMAMSIAMRLRPEKINTIANLKTAERKGRKKAIAAADSQDLADKADKQAKPTRKQQRSRTVREL
jgi:hypothetical protein